jgi:hypothetical protein
MQLIRTHSMKILGALVLAGCATAGSPAPPGPSATSAVMAAPARDVAYGLVMQATSCWMGGLWSDALGEKDEDRSAGIRRRCDELSRALGAPVEGVSKQAVEEKTVDLLSQRVETLATKGTEEKSHAKELSSLLRLVADATWETKRARIAADKVKNDAAREPSASEYGAFKAAAAPDLAQIEKLHALFHADVGPYATEARIIGLMTAIDRMEIARGLPMHLKIYVVEGAYREVFGVAAPPVADDPAAPIKAGAWLAYALQVAAAAGHPVPGDAQKPENRETLAWNGILEGYADKLRALESELPASTQLGGVAHAIDVRLDKQYKTERALFEAKPAPR